MDVEEIDKFIDDDAPDVYAQENLVLKPLLEEIGEISDIGVASFVRSVLLNSMLFWSVPVMPSGDEEIEWPHDTYCVGGDLLNTKRVFRVAELLCDSYQLESLDRDVVLAASLIHSVTKFELVDSTPVYNYMYPYTLDRYVEELRSSQQITSSEHKSSTLTVDDETVYIILRLVRCQNGPWSIIPETLPSNTLEMIVHLAFRMAMSLEYIVDGDDVKEERWRC